MIKYTTNEKSSYLNSRIFCWAPFAPWGPELSCSNIVGKLFFFFFAQKKKKIFSVSICHPNALTDSCQMCLQVHILLALRHFAPFFKTSSILYLKVLISSRKFFALAWKSIEKKKKKKRKEKKKEKKKKKEKGKKISYNKLCKPFPIYAWTYCIAILGLRDLLS